MFRPHPFIPFYFHAPEAGATAAKAKAAAAEHAAPAKAACDIVIAYLTKIAAQKGDDVVKKAGVGLTKSLILLSSLQSSSELQAASISATRETSILPNRRNHDQMRMRHDVTRKAKRRSYREDYDKVDDDIAEDQRRLAAITTEKKLLAARIKDQKAKKKEMGRVPRHSNSRRTAASSSQIPQFVQHNQDLGDGQFEISDSNSDASSEFPEVTSLLDVAVNESNISTGPMSSPTMISDAASKFEAPAFAPMIPVSDVYFDSGHMYPDSEPGSAITMDFSEKSPRWAALRTNSSLRFSVPPSDGSFNTDSYSGAIMPASDGFDFGSSEPEVDLNFFATMFPGPPPTSSPPQQWRLTLPPVPPSSPSVTLAPDTANAADSGMKARQGGSKRYNTGEKTTQSPSSQGLKIT
ncbi:hypothetical protein K438DRAFT_1988007 [Mycena galopus ATCC 62051]|nr:hypothetical protein K438DRAFT_1988007 [Mycena galopus ATCC 62051]